MSKEWPSKGALKKSSKSAMLRRSFSDAEAVMEESAVYGGANIPIVGGNLLPINRYKSRNPDVSRALKDQWKRWKRKFSTKKSSRLKRVWTLFPRGWSGSNVWLFFVGKCASMVECFASDGCISEGGFPFGWREGLMKFPSSSMGDSIIFNGQFHAHLVFHYQNQCHLIDFDIGDRQPTSMGWFLSA